MPVEITDAARAQVESELKQLSQLDKVRALPHAISDFIEVGDDPLYRQLDVKGGARISDRHAAFIRSILVKGYRYAALAEATAAAAESIGLDANVLFRIIDHPTPDSSKAATALARQVYSRMVSGTENPDHYETLILRQLVAARRPLSQLEIQHCEAGRGPDPKTTRGRLKGLIGRGYVVAVGARWAATDKAREFIRNVQIPD
jgi:hypothetical protein